MRSLIVFWAYHNLHVAALLLLTPPSASHTSVCGSVLPGTSQPIRGNDKLDSPVSLRISMIRYHLWVMDECDPIDLSLIIIIYLYIYIYRFQILLGRCIYDYTWVAFGPVKTNAKIAQAILDATLQMSHPKSEAAGPQPSFLMPLIAQGPPLLGVLGRQSELKSTFKWIHWKWSCHCKSFQGMFPLYHDNLIFIMLIQFYIYIYIYILYNIML